MNRLVCALIGSSLLFSGCATPRRADATLARSLALHDYRDQRRLELLDDATHSRVEQYSQVRADGNVKLLTSEVMDALVEHLHSNGFDEFALRGELPRSPVAGVVWGLELSAGERVQYVLGYPGGLSAEQQQRLRKLRLAFFEAYNSVYSLQAVELQPGQSPFKAPELPARPRR